MGSRLSDSAIQRLSDSYCLPGTFVYFRTATSALDVPCAALFRQHLCFAQRRGLRQVWPAQGFEVLVCLGSVVLCHQIAEEHDWGEEGGVGRGDSVGVGVVSR